MSVREIERRKERRGAMLILGFLRPFSSTGSHVTKEGETDRQADKQPDRQTDIRRKSKNTGAIAGTPQNAMFES